MPSKPPPPPFPSNRFEFLGTIFVRFCPQWESSLDDESDDDIHFEDASPIVRWTCASPKRDAALLFRRRRFRRLSEEDDDDDDDEAVSAKRFDFARNVFLFFSILALVSVVHLKLDLDNDREDACILLVVANASLLVVAPEEEDNDKGANMISLCGETPPQKRVCIHSTHARVGRGTHGQTSGPRILHDAHDETEQEIWLLQRETKHLPRVAREESRRRRKREIRFARLEKTDVRDSGRIE